MSRVDGPSLSRTGAHASELERAIEALAAGEPVVFPTDTVYGLGVAVRHAHSPQAIFDIKGRGGDKPVAWLVDSPQALREFGEEVPAWACELAQEHWPGALTLVVKASAAVPAQFASREGTIGLRMPADEVALALIDAVGPLATSSANLSGCGDVLSLGDVDPQVRNAVSVCLGEEDEGAGAPGRGIWPMANGDRAELKGGRTDACDARGGRSGCGSRPGLSDGGAVAASTVVDCSGDKPRVLRQGAIILQADISR